MAELCVFLCLAAGFFYAGMMWLALGVIAKDREPPDVARLEIDYYYEGFRGYSSEHPGLKIGQVVWLPIKVREIERVSPLPDEPYWAVSFMPVGKLAGSTPDHRTLLVAVWKTQAVIRS